MSNKIKDNKLIKKSVGFAGEFKTFISKGSVIDLAIGMIIGSAFTSIVNSLVKDIFMPVSGLVLNGVNFAQFKIELPIGDKPIIEIGSFIQNVITFLLTAFCLFLVIKFISIFKRKKAEAPAEPPKKADDVVVLEEIRDLLKAQNSQDNNQNEKRD